MKTILIIVAFLLLPFAVGTAGSKGGINKKLLLGAWTSQGESFEFDIRDKTIFYEFDMKEHPYKLEKDVLVVDFQDPTLGVQRKKILRLTRDELELEDLTYDVKATYWRVK